MRPSSKEIWSIVASEVARSGGWDSAVKRLLDFLKDLNEAMNFMTHWSMGSVLCLEPAQRLDRWGMTVNLSERVEREADFRRELLRNPRYVSALAVLEGLGIQPIYYLWQVSAVIVVEEEPGLHWLVLPACHRGCKSSVALGSPPSNGSCQMCGKPSGLTKRCQRMPSPEATPEERIHEVDEFIVRAVQADASSRSRLLADPTAFFAQASQALFGLRPQETFGIREVKVAAETDTVLYVVLLAEHDLNKAVKNEPMRVMGIS